MDIGQRLGPYELKERVGQGGMAVVYRGLDTRLSRPVAVKVLHRHLADSSEARSRFEREARAVAKLRHENILEIFAFSGSDSPDNYIVTEFIDGRTLKAFAEAHPIRYPEIAAMIAIELCRALEHAHAFGVLHRDIKPENIMVQTGTVLKLMDFGIAQMIDQERVTMTGQLLGSPAYMAPEHVEGQALDFRADVFAVGVVTYQLATGLLPFDGKNPHETLKKITDGTFVAPDRRNPLCGRTLCQVIAKALARNRDERYPDVCSLRADLEAVLSEVGLTDTRAELAAFFVAPAAYQKALADRLIEALDARGSMLKKRNPAAALDAWNRVLCLDPTRSDLRAQAEALAMRPRWRRVGLGCAAGVAVLGLILSVSLISNRGPKTQPAAIRFPDMSPLPVPIPEAVADSVIATLPAESVSTPVKHVTPTPKVKPKAITPPPPPLPALRQVTLNVSPQNSEVQIDGGAWQPLAGTQKVVTLPPGAAELAIRNPLCCEAKSVTLGPTQTEISATLDFLPATVVPECDWPDVSVRIDGKLARVGRPTTIALKNTLGRRRVHVEFFNEHFYETDVDVRYNETVAVTCGTR